MPEQSKSTFNHFSFFSFSDSYFSLPHSERRQINQQWIACLNQASEHVEIYQVYPAHPGVDILVWSAISGDSTEQPYRFFTDFASATNPFRQWMRAGTVLWGFTRPSQYTKTRSAQEIDPFSEERRPYLVVYPFTKTIPWYLMNREARQGMMNEHIRIGKQYPEITQLLLYSFGLQDQEFIVVYETQDLKQFSDLVYELRGSEARRYTERDTPVFSAIHHSPEGTMDLWV